MKRAAWVGIALGACPAVACGDDSEDGHTPSIDVAAACGRIADASCQKLVECRAIVGGRQMTASLCAEIRAAQVDACRSEAAHTAATQSDVDACVSGFQGFACSDICGKVPQDPPACRALSTATNEDVFTCQ